MWIALTYPFTADSSSSSSPELYHFFIFSSRAPGSAPRSESIFILLRKKKNIGIAETPFVAAVSWNFVHDFVSSKVRKPLNKQMLMECYWIIVMKELKTWHWSTSTLRNTALGYFEASCSKMGLILWHGPLLKNDSTFKKIHRLLIMRFSFDQTNLRMLASFSVLPKLFLACHSDASISRKSR